MWKLVPALVGLMGQAYPELIEAQSRIAEILRIGAGSLRNFAEL